MAFSALLEKVKTATKYMKGKSTTGLESIEDLCSCTEHLSYISLFSKVLMLIPWRFSKETMTSSVLELIEKTSNVLEIIKTFNIKLTELWLTSEWFMILGHENANAIIRTRNERFDIPFHVT